MSRSRRPRRDPSRQRHNLRPFLERLEDRTLPSAALPVDLAVSSDFLTDGRPYDPSRILVQFREGVDAAGAALAGTAVGAEISLVPGLHPVTLTPGVGVADALRYYGNHPGVLQVSPDYVIDFLNTPNDPNFGIQWGHNNTGQTGGVPDADIDAPEAWDVTTGGSQVVVAVIDSGVDYNHPDLAANMWTNPGEIPGNSVDDDGNGRVDDVHGYDFFNNDADPMDDVGHGTHVAGIIGAVGNNNTGISGVAWNVKLMALKVGGPTGPNLSSAIQAVDYAVAMGARISNNSYGIGAFSDLFRQAIANADTAGHVFVAAAGNSSSDNDRFPAYPANFNVPNIVSVAASDHNDSLAGFSNYGATTVDLAAPGDNIFSTLPNNLYGAQSGTSMAAPQVAGVLALIAALRPSWGPDQLINQVLSTTDRLVGMTGRTVTGGRLNAAAAVSLAPVDSTGPVIDVSTPGGTVTGPVSRVRVTFSESINVATFTVADLVSFTGPNGTISLGGATVSEVAGSDGFSFDITFRPQTILGDYTLVLGPNILDLAGNAMDQDGDGRNGEDPADRYAALFTIGSSLIFTSADTPLPIQDFGVVVSAITVDQDAGVADVDVRIDVTHTYDADLHISLVSPAGTHVVLAAHRGGGGDDFRNTRFDDEAARTISSGAPPFAGSYRPETGLWAVDGENARGTWYLVIEDRAFLDQGTLRSWTLYVTPGNSRPDAQDDYAMTTEGTPVTVDVLANDTDLDGDLLAVSVLQTFNGTTLVNRDRTVTFTPDAGFLGGAGFAYRIDDGRGGFDIAFAAIDVLPIFLPFPFGGIAPRGPAPAFSGAGPLDPGSLGFLDPESGDEMGELPPLPPAVPGPFSVTPAAPGASPAAGAEAAPTPLSRVRLSEEPDEGEDGSRLFPDL